jgi:signal transduction histidine kinase
MGVPMREQRSRRLIDEVQLLAIALSTVIILVVQISSILIISYSMGASLRKDAVRVADELVSYLSEPMYNVDDEQTVRMAESMLVSGRLSGIELVSTASGTLISEMPGKESRIIAPITRNIVYNDDLLLGTVTLHYSDAEINATKRRIVYIGMLILAAVIAVNLVVNRFLLKQRVFRSLESIVNGIGLIRIGDYSARIESSRYDDVNVLINLINEMSSSILAKSSQLVESNALLENRVAERTEELSRSLSDLRQAQNRLVESGKLSALGLLAAGMAHELNTPLGAILASNRNVIDFLEAKTRSFHPFFRSLTDREASLFDMVISRGASLSRRLDLQEPSRARQREIREDMARLGVEDPAGVAECLIDMGLDPADGALRPLLAEPRALTVLQAASDILVTRRMAEVVDVAGKKASTVVSALRLYLSSDNDDMEASVDIDATVDNILTLMHNMLKHGVTVKREFSGARTKGSAEKLGQVWMNIIRNAAQAMDFNGELVIRTGFDGSWAFVSFIDSGPGIPDDVLPRVFDPFFTTKKQGEGMGLGLDICRRIVEAHKGSISIDTRPGRTEFRVSLPSS